MALPETTICRPMARSTLNGAQLFGGALSSRARLRAAASPDEVEAVEAEVVSEAVSSPGMEVEPVLSLVLVVEELLCPLSAWAD